MLILHEEVDLQELNTCFKEYRRLKVSEIAFCDEYVAQKQLDMPICNCIIDSANSSVYIFLIFICQRLIMLDIKYYQMRKLEYLSHHRTEL